MNLNDERAKEYHDGLLRKLNDLEQLATVSEGSEHVRLGGKAEGVKIAIEDFEYLANNFRSESMEQIVAHLKQLEQDEEAIKKDLMKAPENRPVAGTSNQTLERMLMETQGAATGVRQVISIILHGDPHIVEPREAGGHQ